MKYIYTAVIGVSHDQISGAHPGPVLTHWVGIVLYFITAQKPPNGVYCTIVTII